MAKKDPVKDAYKRMAYRLSAQGMKPESILESLDSFKIETPSWGYGDSGTRFGVFPFPGAARNLEERIEDAACVNKLTGACPTVAIHIPWDKVDDFQPYGAFGNALYGLEAGVEFTADILCVKILRKGL